MPLPNQIHEKVINMHDHDTLTLMSHVDLASWPNNGCILLTVLMYIFNNMVGVMQKQVFVIDIPKEGLGGFWYDTDFRI